MKSIYPLKSMIKDIASLLRHQGRYYIDTSGYFFTKEKTNQLGPYRNEGYWKEKGQFYSEEEPPPECPFHKSEKDD